MEPLLTNSLLLIIRTKSFSIVVLVVQLLFFLCSYLADPERGRSEGINLKEMQQKVQIVMLKIVCAAVA